MSRVATPKLGAYSGLAALGLLAALVLGRPEIVVLAAPFALVVAGGLLFGRPPEIGARLFLPTERMLEGEEAAAHVELASEAPVFELEVFLDLPDGIGLRESRNPRAIRLGEDTRTLDYRLAAEHWGAYMVGDVVIRARDVYGLFLYGEELALRRPVKVYPGAEALLRVVRPRDTQVFAGNQVARVKGEGIEFADLRPFSSGDRIRRINWRASARRGELWVNEHYPERNADVVVFLDSFAEARRDTDALTAKRATQPRAQASAEGTLDMSVRAAASLLAAYVGQRDRVGFVSFGGILRWLRPGTGLAQLYRVVDALLDTEIFLNYAWKGIDVIPHGTLPPQALVVALTPLLDERSIAALLDLRGRGFDLVIVEISPVPFTKPGGGKLEGLAHRLWTMRREALRARYERAGAAIIEWREDIPLTSVIEEVSAFRRQARRARV